MIFPESVKPSSISITSVTPNLVSVTHSLKRQVRQRGAQRWLMEVSFPSMSRSEFAPLWAFANNRKGQFETFTFRPEIYKDSSGTASGAIVTDGANVAGATDISITGIDSGTQLNAGDYITFATNDKVYIIVDTTTATGTTTAIQIEPPLLEDVVSGAGISYTDVQFTVAFDGDTQTMDVATNGRTSWGMSLVEVV